MSIDSNGVVEIKSPYKVRTMDPLIRCYMGKWKYCNENGNLKVSSDYYQIQGILEITNREWYDLVS